MSDHSQQCRRIREELARDPDCKLGFVIYRLTYTDDAQWARFMDHLNTRVRLHLESIGDGDIFPHIDWDVQEDPVLFAEPEDRVIREHFKEYIRQADRDNGSPRYMACVNVMQTHVESVLEGPGPEKFDAFASGFVELLSQDEEEGYAMVGLSYLFPRVYSLMSAMGWYSIVKDKDREEIFAE
ncbi:hypothetical protein BS50DRAFT_568922 [Corynespora cassiicola Philippines]|uniref:Uncharacterized protein n=1 Tax=Corynespora cassiicola Philippines TaxID=1448308 RepID=A0A2T2P6R5_CORCC|nr:hypothetical protein BS50DRAFT_568922 [Corynespora cassiicola Philippines]